MSGNTFDKLVEIYMLDKMDIMSNEMHWKHKKKGDGNKMDWSMEMDRHFADDEKGNKEQYFVL